MDSIWGAGKQRMAEGDLLEYLSGVEIRVPGECFSFVQVKVLELTVV